jgi:hypothetical protein
MRGRATTLLVGAAVIAAALLIGVRVARNSSTGAESPATESGASFSAKTSWGEPNLTGVWKAAALGAQSGRDTFNLTMLEGLYTPEARARMKTLSAKDDPTMHCAPPSFPRAAMLGQRVQIIQRPGFAFVFTEAYPVFRIIPTTGRPHTSDQYLFPTHMGDSAARWEADTLVVDVLSFNGEGWLASPDDKPTQASTGVWPTSDALHVVERWRRVDADTLEYEARVEDPKSLTMPWSTPTVVFKRQAADRIEEALCRPEDGPESYLARLAS